MHIQDKPWCNPYPRINRICHSERYICLKHFSQRQWWAKEKGYLFYFFLNEALSIITANNLDKHHLFSIRFFYRNWLLRSLLLRHRKNSSYRQQEQKIIYQWNLNQDIMLRRSMIQLTITNLPTHLHKNKVQMKYEDNKIQYSLMYIKSRPKALRTNWPLWYPARILV